MGKPNQNIKPSKQKSYTAKTDQGWGPQNIFLGREQDWLAIIFLLYLSFVSII